LNSYKGKKSIYCGGDAESQIYYYLDEEGE